MALDWRCLSGRQTLQDRRCTPRRHRSKSCLAGKALSLLQQWKGKQSLQDKWCTMMHPPRSTFQQGKAACLCHQVAGKPNLAGIADMKYHFEPRFRQDNCTRTHPRWPCHRMRTLMGTLCRTCCLD